MNKKKVLILASVASMIDQFNMPNIRLMQEMGCEVHVACNFREGNTCDVQRLHRLKKKLQDMHAVRHQWDCPREIFPAGRCWKAYRQLLALMKEQGFAWMHCQSPVGGALARLAAHRAGIPVIYTAHGFHFYKGAPLKNWLLYYPAEKLLAHWTDVLVTVNREDYALAARRLKAAKICYIPGIGIDTEKFSAARPRKAQRPDAPAGGADAGKPASERKNAAQGRNPEKMNLRRKFGIPEDAVVLLSAGELNKGKNHRLVISALAGIQRKDVYYIICGQGVLKEALQRHAARLGVADRIRMPGFWEDMPWIYQNTDIFVLPSVREGMPAALMEAMAAGMPCAASDIRGNRELIGAGMRFSPKNCARLQKILETFIEDERLRECCGKRNQRKIQNYSRKIVEQKMKEIYAGRKNESSIKVLHVLKTGFYSGAENTAVTICRALGSPYIAAYTSLDGRIARYVRGAGIRFYPMKRFGAREMNRVLREYRPDIVHAHDFSASVLAALLKKDYRLVSHLHNDPPWIRRWRLNSVIYWLAEKRIDQILAVSREIQEEAVFLKDNDRSIRIINNPLDIMGIRQKAEEFQPKEKDLVFVGRLTRQKNPQRFIRIVSRLRERKKDISAVMAGDGELKAECREMICSLGLERNIQMLGFQENPYPYIRRAKLLVVTSDWEGYGLAAAEAAALDTPVLAVPAGGLRTIFKDCPEAFYTTEEEACRKVLQLLQNRTAYQKFRREVCGRASVEETGRYIARLSSIYRKLCRKPAGT